MLNDGRILVVEYKGKPIQNSIDDFINHIKKVMKNIKEDISTIVAPADVPI